MRIDKEGLSGNLVRAFWVEKKKGKRVFWVKEWGSAGVSRKSDEGERTK